MTSPNSFLRGLGCLTDLIRFDSAAAVNWQNILRYAHPRDLVSAIVEAARGEEHSPSVAEELTQAEREYLQSLPEAPDVTPTDVIPPLPWWRRILRRIQWLLDQPPWRKWALRIVFVILVIVIVIVAVNGSSRGGLFPGRQTPTPTSTSTQMRTLTPSSTPDTLPSTPGSFAVTDEGNTLKFTWEDRSSNEFQFCIDEKRQGASGGRAICTNEPNREEMTISKPIVPGTHHYFIRACTISKCSAASPTLVVTVSPSVIARGTVRLVDTQSLDFLTGSVGTYTGGDLYVRLSPLSCKGLDSFLANNTPQRGGVDLGILPESDLSLVQVPTSESAYDRFCVPIRQDHVYAYLQNREGLVAVFRVTAYQERQSIDLEYVVIESP